MGRKVSCGLFGLSDDFIESYQSLDERFIKNKTSSFLFEASGDSMEPTIFKGLGQHIIKVNSNFGNYIRLAVSIEGGEMFLNLHIACKG